MHWLAGLLPEGFQGSGPRGEGDLGVWRCIEKDMIFRGDEDVGPAKVRAADVRKVVTYGIGVGGWRGGWQTREVGAMGGRMGLVVVASNVGCAVGVG
jgi:hypothetical protein